MKILLTGSSGYIGRNLIPKIIECGHEVYILTRKQKDNLSKNKIHYITHNIYEDDISKKKIETKFDLLIHLSWKNLPNYEKDIHINDSLLSELYFFDQIKKLSILRYMVSGTCFEYGPYDGQVNENTLCTPNTPYGISKNLLYKHLVNQLFDSSKVQWLRLFYVFGNDQKETSLYRSFHNAVNENKKQFYLSKGNKIRDFIHINNVVEKILYLIKHPSIYGPINICSNNPISIKEFVENQKKILKSSINIINKVQTKEEFDDYDFWGSSIYFN